MAHTPGPWMATENGTILSQYLIDKAKNNAEYANEIGEICQCWEDYYDGNFLPQSECIANAKLMAAAPDLFEVLSELYDSDQTMVFIPRHIQKKMKAAIEKARKTGPLENF